MSPRAIDPQAIVAAAVSGAAAALADQLGGLGLSSTAQQSYIDQAGQILRAQAVAVAAGEDVARLQADTQAQARLLAERVRLSLSKEARVAHDAIWRVAVAVIATAAKAALPA